MSATAEQKELFWDKVYDYPYGQIPGVEEKEVEFYKTNLLGFGRMLTRDTMEFTTKQISFLNTISDMDILNIILRTQRGGSKSFLYGLVNTWTAFHFPGYVSTVLGGSKEQSDKVGEYITDFIVDNDRLHDYVTSHNTKRIIVEPYWFKKNKRSRINYLFASSKSVRGPHPSALFLDETVEIKPMLIESSLGQLMSPKMGIYPHGRLVVTSTAHQGPGIGKFRNFWDGSVQEMTKRYNAIDREEPIDVWLRENGCNNMTAHSWTALDCIVPGWLTTEQIERFRALLSDEMFKVDILGEFSTAAGMIFNDEDLTAAFTPTVFPQYNLDISKNPICMGIDWGGEGQAAHPTVVTVLQSQGRKDYSNRDINKMVCLHAEGGSHRTYTQWIERMVNLAWHYKPRKIFCDNSHKGEIERLSNGIIETDIGNFKNYRFNVEGIPFVSNKFAMIENLQFVLNKKLLEVHPTFMLTQQQMKNYHYVNEPDQKLKTTKTDDDYVDSMMLTAYALADFFRYINLGSRRKAGLGGVGDKKSKAVRGEKSNRRNRRGLAGA